MPIRINGDTFYRTSEAAKMAGISRSTLLRWLDEGVIKEASRRDRRGWRLFSQVDIDGISHEASRVK